MRDHRPGHDPTVKVDITRQLLEAYNRAGDARPRETGHPGSTSPNDKAAARARAKRAKVARKANRRG